MSLELNIFLVLQFHFQLQHSPFMILRITTILQNLCLNHQSTNLLHSNHTYLKITLIFCSLSCFCLLEFIFKLYFFTYSIFTFKTLQFLSFVCTFPFMLCLVFTFLLTVVPICFFCF